MDSLDDETRKQKSFHLNLRVFYCFRRKVLAAMAIVLLTLIPLE